MAGLLSLIAAALILATWYIMLFVAQPDDAPILESARNSARYFLFVDPLRQWFLWLALVPAASIVIGLCYLAGAARNRKSAKALFAASIVLGGSSFFFLTAALAFFVALPCYWGYLCVRNA